MFQVGRADPDAGAPADWVLLAVSDHYRVKEGGAINLRVPPLPRPAARSVLFAAARARRAGGPRRPGGGPSRPRPPPCFVLIGHAASFTPY
jgi:hypothetical protein